MSIRCIVLDLDRTTLNQRGKLSAANRAAIEDAMEKGVEVVIASGRSYSSLPEEVTGIPGIRYAITSNGAAIHRIPSGECIRRHLMKESSVDAVLSVIAGPFADGTIACEGFTDGVPHCSADYYDHPMKYGASGQGAGYIRSTRRPEKDILRFIQDHRDRMDCIDAIVKDPEDKERLWARLEREAADIYITSSLDRLIEVSDQHSGKHHAVRDLLGLLKIRPEETAAFGDADNDARMFAFVGAGVAVENATERCKQSADYITASHEEDGVARWIREVLPKL